MSNVIELSLILLIFVLIAAVIVVSVYLVKLLIELNVLTKNANETTTVVKREIEPILEELKKTMASVNTIAKNADNQVASFRKIFTTVFGVSSIFLGGMKNVSGGFLKGFQSAFSMFRKK